jgi:4-hydroxy-tetrahydrodipicolinate reductase
VRLGDVVGEHDVYLAGPGERLRLGHVASSRRAFAEGAVRAALWLAGRPPGACTFDDVLTA